MATRTATQAETKTNNGSQPINDAEGFQAEVTEKATQSPNSGLDAISTFGHASERVGRELLAQGTSALHEGYEVSAKVTGAVLDATKDAVNSFSASFDPLSGWSRLLDTSTQAYTDSTSRLAASAEGATEKIRTAVHVLSDELQANAARLSR
jgi:hypothetical protein